MLTCFRAYDVRGRLGVDLDAGIARRIGRALAEELGAARVVLGRDCRLSSPALAAAVAEGVMCTGAEVLDLGLAGTEEVYFATDHLGADAGIAVTASHNPADWNGMKFVGRAAAPLDPAGVLRAVEARARLETFAPPRPGGRITDASAARAAYAARVAGFVDRAALRPLTVLVNCGNGAAGPALDAVAARLAGTPLRLLRLHDTPDGRFPNGVPNPLLPENRPATAAAVRAAGADLGVAFDGDFDRCFLFDHRGDFVAGEFVVGLLAGAFLAREPGAAIVHDPRVIWNIRDVVARAGGRAVAAPTGHVFLKAAMRASGAVYGGELSGHHYFRDFMACDSGMIPWLLAAEAVSRAGRPLANLLAERIAAFPSSGEISFRLADPAAALAAAEARLGPGAQARDLTDGLGLDFGDWRLNLRASNTEPLVRLNVEARGDAGLVEAGVARVRAAIGA
jgi:phosphomannomutase